MRFDGRNEPCAQSWKTMKVRTRKPAASSESATASASEILSAKHAAAMSPRYGTIEVSAFAIALLSRGTA